MAPSLLDLPISFFEYDLARNTFANVPSQQTTLRRMASTRYYQKPIEAIRSESDKHKQDEMKKHLSAFTLALLRHRKKDTSFEEKIIYQWPLLMGDCDQKDNPGVDMAELKTHLSTLPYVLLCAYSVRGGLWFVVRLPDNQTPDTLAAHFRYLQKLFTDKFGIKLDSTKGGKPTDLRFVSFDAAPYLNDEATVFSGTYTPPPPRRKQVPYNPNLKDNEGKLLARVVKMVENAGEGQRHEMLLKAARLAGGFVAANRLDEQTVTLALETIVSEWPQFSKSQKTIRDGIRYGQDFPIYPERLPERPVERWISRRQPTKNVEPVFHPYAEQIYNQSQRIEESVPKSEIRDSSILESIIHVEDFHDGPIEIALRPHKIPTLIRHYWALFDHPPLAWNRWRTLRYIREWVEKPNPDSELIDQPVIVTSIADQLASPGAIIRPDESQLERLDVEDTDDYPADWDEPALPDTVSTIRVSTPTSGSYFKWQNCPESPFSKLGLASLTQQ
jgi:hypothetical protein